MPRKGQQKVRTGCLTCKQVKFTFPTQLWDRWLIPHLPFECRTRKIKCDEVHPACLKCRSTGRKCDGYEAPPPGSYSWEELLLWSRPVPRNVSGANLVDLRGLTFFNRVVASGLSGPLKSSFWTHEVPRAAYSEPAVRYAVLAISSLYQHFGDQRQLCMAKTSPSEDAICHYNSAIKYLTTPGIVSLDTVLLVCILFVCTEFLCDNAQAAITHVSHGLSLVDSSKSSSDIASVLRHLAIFPHFFSHGVPNVPLPDYPDSLAVDGAFKTLSHAQECLDSLACHTVRLVRMVDHHRLGIGPELQSRESGALKQKKLEEDLEIWRAAFYKLRRNLRSRTEHELCLLLLEMRWLVARIWASTCLSSDEMIYDAYLASFSRIVELGLQAKVQMSFSGTAPGAFSFAMGFSPLLHFVVLKCRYLVLRLTAQTLMRALSCSRESLWDFATMSAIGTRIIEKEHGIPVLSEEIVALQSSQDEQHVLPKDEQRVRDSALEADTEVWTDGQGTEMCRRKIRFLVKPGRGRVKAVYDWVTIR
jgi:hypothetical protein